MTGEAVIMITVREGEDGRLHSTHEVAGLDEFMVAVVLMDIGRDILMDLARRHGLRVVEGVAAGIEANGTARQTGVAGEGVNPRILPGAGG